MLGPLDPECVGVGEEVLDEPGGVGAQRLARFRRSPDRLVVHIGEVHDLAHPVALEAQEPRSVSSTTKVRKLPMCPRAYTVRPQVYIRTSCGRRGVKGSTLPPRVFRSRNAPLVA